LELALGLDKDGF